LECDGQAIEDDEKRAPVDKVRKNKGKNPIPIQAPVPGSENAKRRPTQFEPKEVADGNGQSEPGNESKKIEGYFRGDDLPLCAHTKEGRLEKIEKINEKSVGAEKDKIPT
jgi:hypothetical protein